MFSAVAWGGMSHSKCHPSFACNSVVYFNNKPTTGFLCLLLSVATDVYNCARAHFVPTPNEGISDFNIGR